MIPPTVLAIGIDRATTATIMNLKWSQIARTQHKVLHTMWRTLSGLFPIVCSLLPHLLFHRYNDGWTEHVAPFHLHLQLHRLSALLRRPSFLPINSSWQRAVSQCSVEETVETLQCLFSFGVRVSSAITINIYGDPKSSPTRPALQDVFTRAASCIVLWCDICVV